MQKRYLVKLFAVLIVVLLGAASVWQIRRNETRAVPLLIDELIIGQTYNRRGNLVPFIQVGTHHYLYGLFDREFLHAASLHRMIKADVRLAHEWPKEVEFYELDVWVSAARAAQTDGMVYVIGLDVDKRYSIFGWAFAREFDPLWDVSLMPGEYSLNVRRLTEELIEKEGRVVWINF